MARENTGIELLRQAVRLFNECNETFNAQFSAEELLYLYYAFRAGDWDITPDHWTKRQVKEAVKKKTPPDFTYAKDQYTLVAVYDGKASKDRLR